MWFLIISILCSVSVGILFRIVKFSADQLIWALLTTYITCLALSYFYFSPELSPSHLSKNTWIIVGFLSLLMPSVFIALKKSIEKNGIAKTDVIQRLSLFLPLLASFLLFKETLSTSKAIALTIGLSSIYFIVYKKGNHSTKSNDYLYLLLIFFGYGIVDILFKSITKLPFKEILTWVFLGCTISTILYIIIRSKKLQTRGLLIGPILGTLNFFNIYCYLQAHRSFKESPTIVFTGMNLGVITMGVIIGWLFFNEKISKKNSIGIIMATVAIVLLYTSLL